MSNRSKKKGTPQHSALTASPQHSVKTPSAPPTADVNEPGPAQRSERNVFQIALDGSLREEIFVPPGMLARSSRAVDGKTVLYVSGGDPAAEFMGSH